MKQMKTSLPFSIFKEILYTPRKSTVNQKQEKVSQRQSGIELLRILAAMGVILIHYNGNYAFTYVNQQSLNQYLLFFLESCCICAVDLFIFISGYFLCTTQKRSLGKVLGLLIQLTFFKEIFFILPHIINHDINTTTFLKGIRWNFIPQNYFVILYIVLYIFSPYINILLSSFTKKQFKYFILIFFLIYSLYSTGVDILGEIHGESFFGLSPLGAWGNQRGFNIVNFILLYVLGAYIRGNNIIIKRLKTPLLVFMLLIIQTMIFVWALANERTSGIGFRSAWCYHNPFVIIEAILYFVIFLRLSFYSKIINSLAKAAFTCFLIHGTFLSQLRIQQFVNQNIIFLLGHILISCAILYILSFMMFVLYDLCTGKILNKMNQIQLFNENNIPIIRN